MFSILIIGACSVNKPGDIVLSFYVKLITRIIKSRFLNIEINDLIFNFKPIYIKLKRQTSLLFAFNDLLK